MSAVGLSWKAEIICVLKVDVAFLYKGDNGTETIYVF